MVIAGRDIRDQRPEGVEGRAVAEFLLAFDVFPDEVEGDVAWSFDHDLHVVFPGAFGQFGQGVEFGELCGVVGVGRGSRAQPVAERKRDVVAGEDFTQLVEAGVEEVFLVVCEAPAGHDGSAAGDDAGDPVGGQGHVAQQYAGVDGHVVHALLALFNDGVG